MKDSFSLHLINHFNVRYEQKVVDIISDSIHEHKICFLEKPESFSLPNKIYSSYIYRKKVLDFRWFIQYIRLVKNSKNIFFHSFPNFPYLIPLIFSRKRLFWIIWGADLYGNDIFQNGIFRNIYKFMKKQILKKVNYVISLNKDDFSFLKQKFKKTNPKLKFIYAFYPYPINTTNFVDFTTKERTQPYILLGNSGSENNHHIDIMEYLNQANFSDTKFICPLSYGGTNQYLESVNIYGEQNFSHFLTIESHISLEKFEEILKNVNILIMNHYRPQAVGTIFLGVYALNMIYINKKNPLQHFLNEIGIKFYFIQDLNSKTPFLNFSHEIALKNRTNLDKFLKNHTSHEIWEKIFRI